MIEFVGVWILTGIVLDAICMSYIAYTENVWWDRRAEEAGYNREDCPTYTALEMVKESPWWVHVLMIAFPPSAILRMTM